MPVPALFPFFCFGSLVPLATQFIRAFCDMHHTSPHNICFPSRRTYRSRSLLHHGHFPKSSHVKAFLLEWVLSNWLEEKYLITTSTFHRPYLWHLSYLYASFLLVQSVRNGMDCVSVCIWASNETKPGSDFWLGSPKKQSWAKLWSTLIPMVVISGFYAIGLSAHLSHLSTYPHQLPERSWDHTSYWQLLDHFT